jgi:hypothetical protein
MFVSVCKEKPCFYLELDSEVHPEKMFHTKRRIHEFIVDETLTRVGNEFV